MPSPTDLARLTVGQFAERFRQEMIPLSSRFAYFFVGLPLTEEEIKEYLEEPVAALPPAIVSTLPKISMVLVPYLERANGKERGHGAYEDVVSLEKPAENRGIAATQLITSREAILLFGIKDRDVADYHYLLYRAISRLMGDRLSEEAQTQYYSLIREELNARAHGEVDEESWRQKQVLLRRQSTVRRETKSFVTYARQSFIDTLTLYLHGICCDIDVDTGPRQLPSRFLRKRLVLLHTLYPPPDGYAVFPEELSETERR